MFVKNLDEMESIVSSNNNLGWNGWDVAKYSESNSAIYSKDAEFRNGKWMKKKVFPLTEQGWNIPNYIGRNSAQVEG
jgi:hypothetical protein